MPPAYLFAANYSQIARPLCTRCCGLMWLTKVTPGASQVEHRTFECPVCRASKLEKVNFAFAA
jgi:hypothetical protein